MARRSLYTTIFLVVLCALPPLSIDMGLPSLPAAAAALGVSTNRVGLTVTVFMAGFALSPIIYGSLSDRFGRKPLMIIGLGVFLAGGLACVFAQTLDMLLVARFVQGVGAGSGPTLAFAASRDRLTGHPLGRRLSLLTMLLNVAPVIAPTFGTACLYLGGWRGFLVILAACGLLLLIAALIGFEETRSTTGERSEGVLKRFWIDAVRICRRRDVVYPGLVYGLSAGSMFAYVSTSPLLLMQALGASAPLYAGLFALTGTGIVLGAGLSGRVLSRVSPKTPVAIGLLLTLAGPISACLLLALGSGQLWPVMACLVVATFGYGLIAPAAAHAALDPVSEAAGTASAMMNSMQMMFMAFASLCASLAVAPIGDVGTPAVMVIFALASVVSFYRWVR